MDVCRECFVLSGRGLCDGLITCPEESYRLWCVVVYDLETTKILVNEEEAKALKGAIAPREKKIRLTVGSFILICIDVKLLQQQKSWTVSINCVFFSH